MDDSIRIWGLDISPGAEVAIRAQWGDGSFPAFDYATSSSTVTYHTTDGVDLYYWSVTDSIPRQYWRVATTGRGAPVTASARLQVKGSGNQFISVNPDWYDCFLAHPGAGDFAQSCASSDSPDIVVSARRVTPRLGYASPSSVVAHKYVVLSLHGWNLARPDSNGFNFDQDISIYWRRTTPSVSRWKYVPRPSQTVPLMHWSHWSPNLHVVQALDIGPPGHLEFKVVVRGMDAESNVVAVDVM